MAIENSRSKEQNVRWKKRPWIVTTATVFHLNSREQDHSPNTGKLRLLGCSQFEILVFGGPLPSSQIALLPLGNRIKNFGFQPPVATTVVSNFYKKQTD